MSTVDSVISGMVGSGLPASSTTTAMDQSSFLTLMTAQLQNQDPFEPMDNSQMVAQMAQFSSLAGITEMNSSLKTLAEQGASRLTDASSWIGRSMLVKSNVATPDSIGQYAGELTLSAASEDVNVDLVDGSGNVVKTVALGAQDKGTVAFYWDGKDADGNAVSSGALQVKVRGGTTSQVATWASIAAVQSPGDSSASKLITALGTYSPSDALRLG